MQGVNVRRERVVQALGLVVGLMLFTSFFLPRGSSNHWQFGWDLPAFTMVVQILQVFAGLVLVGLVMLPLPRFLKGVVLLAIGVLLTGLVTVDAIDSFDGFFKRPVWMDRLVWIVFPALAAVFALNADSDRDRSGRQAFGLVGGAVMLMLGVVPLQFGLGESGLRALTAFIDIWDITPGSVGFGEFLFLMTWMVVICMGPIGGALLMLHSAVAISAPRKRLKAAGPVAGAVFLLWFPATLFVFWLFLWAKASLVFTSYAVAVSPMLGCAVLLAAGLYYTGEALAEDVNRAASVSAGLGALVQGSTMAPVAVLGRGPVAADADWPPAPEDDDGSWPEPEVQEAGGPGAPSRSREASDLEDGPTFDAPRATAFARPAPKPAEPEEEAGWSAPAPARETWAAPAPALNEPAAPEAGDKPTQALDISQIEAFSARDSKRPARSAKEEAGEHWEQAGAAWTAQDWERALHHYEHVLRLEPDRTEAIKAIADIHYGLGNVDVAEGYYRRVLQAWPDDRYSQQALEQIELYRQGN